MKKKLSIILLFLTLFCITISLIGCNDNTPNTNSDDVKNNYYNIDLTLDNYWKYVDWDKQNNQFVGVLSFALYDNVNITLERTIYSKYTENTYTEDYSIELNAAGCKEYYLTNYSTEEIKVLLNCTDVSSWTWKLNIIEISGTVQFSI